MVYVITGASTGVGRACALHFAAQGNIVCALARNKIRLEELKRQYPQNIYSYPSDVTDKDQVRNTMAKIDSDHGTIDVLINNAGVNVGAGDPMGLESVDTIIDTNLKGTIYATYAVLPVMKRAGDGSIINIASIAGVDIVPEGSPGLYTASKHGVVAFADTLGRYVRSDGIRITTLCPGGIDTPLWNETNPYPLEKEGMIRPEEIADLIEYLLKQPKRTLFKNVVFIPTMEGW